MAIQYSSMSKNYLERDLLPFLQLSRLEKFPLGSLLVFWPAAWSLTMAAYQSLMDPRLCALYFLGYLLGSIILHSAACTINDICDKDFDAKVERCKSRPLPSGRASVFGATVWTTLQTLSALYLLRNTNNAAWEVGLYGVFPLHALYPLMKRWTHWPQAWLGLAMNWGIPVAWLTVFPAMADRRVPGLLFLGSLSWTILYDTIYACQDRKDDVKAGVNSTAVLFGSRVKEITSAFAGLFVACLYYAGIYNQQGLPYFLISVGGASLHCSWQLITLNPDDEKDCLNKFVANHLTGYIVWLGLMLDYMFKVVAVNVANFETV